MVCDAVRNGDLITESGIQDVVKWVKQRRKQWNKHVERMEDIQFSKLPLRDYIAKCVAMWETI